MKKWICTVVLSLTAFSTVLGVDFDYSRWWGGGTSAKVAVAAEPKAMGDEQGFKFTAEPAPKKETFACVSYAFNPATDMNDFKSIEFSVKSDHAISIMLSLDCEGGTLVGTWLQETAGNDFRKFTFDRTSMKINGKPDLSKVKALAVGFGTWEFDTTKEGFTAIVAGIKIINSQAAASRK
ncbi:MAG: hypothetical protein WCV67_14515 [Victivallaceae bacterium]|jgi:hypothetical protein